MNSLEQWPHRWYGVWLEHGPIYKECPSIRDFVSQDIISHSDKSRLLNYLRNGHVVASTSRSQFPCPFTGVRNTGSISYRTDGTWLWLDDLPEYVEHFNVDIPAALIRFIRENNYTVPYIDPHSLRSLEWPPVSHEARPPD